MTAQSSYWVPSGEETDRILAHVATKSVLWLQGWLPDLLRRVQPWCLEVEELRRPDRERLHLLHDLYCLRWHLLRLTLAGFGLGREVDDHAPLAVIVVNRDATEDVRPELPHVGLLGH